MKKEVMILTGAGQIGMAIARRMGYGKKIVVGDLNPESTEAVCRILNEAGLDAVPVEMNLSSRESILNLIAVARKHGEISMLVNTAGVSPSQASIETILKVDLYGTALILPFISTPENLILQRSDRRRKASATFPCQPAFPVHPPVYAVLPLLL